jgi:hypothetical protein
MKNIGKSLSTLFFVVVILTSCSSVESDAKKVAELQCKAQKMALKVSAGDMSAIEESTKLAAEAVTLAEEMKGKYTTDSERQKFTEALLQELRNCK